MPPTEGPAKGHANIEHFRRASTAIISDNLESLVAARGLRAFHKSGMMIGRALTVMTRAGDNLIIHQALEKITPGDVLVIDAGGDESRALVGEIIVTAAHARGAAGIVIDGAIRDLREISAGNFPCFARSVTYVGPYKEGPGEIGVPVNIGGMIVQPGDIVVGDEDGVIAFPESIVGQLLGAVDGQLAKEAEILKSVAAKTL